MNHSIILHSYDMNIMKMSTFCEKNCNPFQLNVMYTSQMELKLCVCVY